jgi:mechanosensitive ion channel-like protein
MWLSSFLTLASAGIVGLVGSLTAPPDNRKSHRRFADRSVRLADVVTANGEWGQIREITTTYVVLRAGDLRRLILPISYFIQTPFENWRLNTTDLMAYVYVYPDYTMEIWPTC